MQHRLTMPVYRCSLGYGVVVICQMGARVSGFTVKTVMKMKHSLVPVVGIHFPWGCYQKDAIY